MNKCIFCKIIKGKIPAHKVYKDNLVFAFLDKHPINPGHILVVPKKHIPDFYNLDDKNYRALMVAVKKLAKIIKKINPKKVGLFIAGWDVPHTHAHIVPMKNHHDITSKASSLRGGKQANPGDKRLAKMAKQLSL